MAWRNKRGGGNMPQNTGRYVSEKSNQVDITFSPA